MSETLETEIFNRVNARFPSATTHKEKVSGLIAEHVKHVDRLSRITMPEIIRVLRESFTADEWKEVEYMFKALFVSILVSFKQELLLETFDDLCEVYPAFRGVDEAEQLILLEFRNMMVLSQILLDPNGRKGELLSLVGSMCGLSNSSNQTLESKRRLQIYDHESKLNRKIVHEKAKELNFVLNAKRQRFELSESNDALPSAKVTMAQSFWLRHSQLMASGDDIPTEFVPMHEARSCFMYPSHDLKPAWSFHPAMHMHMLMSRPSPLMDSPFYPPRSGVSSVTPPVGRSMTHPANPANPAHHVNHVHHVDPRPFTTADPSVALKPIVIPYGYSAYPPLPPPSPTSSPTSSSTSSTSSVVDKAPPVYDPSRYQHQQLAPPPAAFFNAAAEGPIVQSTNLF